MGGRGQIESNDVGGFRFKSWIVGSHEVTQPMGLQPVAPPDASDAHVPEAEFACQTTTAPVSAPIIGAAPRPFQHFGLQSGRIGSGLTPASSATRPLKRVWRNRLVQRCTYEVLHPRAPAISRTLCPRALLKMTSARRASSERTLRERSRRLSSRRSGGLNIRRLDAIQES